jgi:cytochrome c553
MRNLVLFVLLSSSIISSCYYDNEETLKGTASTCDTAAVRYSVHITKIMNDYCNDCHSTSANLGGVILDNYAAVRGYALDGSLYGSVNHDSKYSPMPKNSAKLSDCNIALIKAWYQAGAPNN